eukprot:GHRR01030484.1.p2 GENE.GHRR01030484.1~~GHRR01030484.1.p2  ORF type:complete len:118 (-),score=18.70 GHRR01030484.1:308-661(-)
MPCFAFVITASHSHLPAHEPFPLPHSCRQWCPGAAVPSTVRVMTLLTVSTIGKIQHIKHMVVSVVAVDVATHVAARAKQAVCKGTVAAVGSPAATIGNGADLQAQAFSHSRHFATQS